MISSRALVLGLFGVLTLPAAAQSPLTIVHVDVEQGDATIVVSPDGHALLFDAGNESKGRDRVVPRLIELGVTRLDYTVLSHYDADHVGGLDEVIVGGFAPLVAYDRGDTVRGTQAVANYVAAAGGLRRTMTPGEIIPLGAEVTIECVAVNGATSEGTSVSVDPDDENESSIAFVVRYRDFDYFVGGDLTAGGLGSRDVESLVAPIVRDVDVLRVSHHGSPTSTGQALVDRLQPEVAIISAGYSNTYAHPDQGVLDRLGAAPSVRRIYATNRGTTTMTGPELVVVGESTADDGEVLLTTDGTTTMSVNGTTYAMVVDRRAPVITGAPQLTALSSDRATVALSTDEPTEVYIEYGFSPTQLDRMAVRRTLATSHALVLGGLAAQATYYYRAAVIDGSGNGPVFGAIASFTTPVATGGMVINEVASAGSDQDEWVELLNTGTVAVDLTGWWLTDNDAHTLVFPGVIVPGGAYVVVTSGNAADDLDARDGLATLHAGGAARFGTTAVWNNEGDDVVLHVPSGARADAMIYGTGTGIDPLPAAELTLDVAAPPRPTSIAQSVARYPNGNDRNLSSDWARPAASTRGASNGGEPPRPPPPPLAEAGAAAQALEGQAVSFDGSASAAQGQAVLVSYSWDFGDGSVGTGAQVSHSYADDGEYVVTLTVRDSLGLSAVDTTAVHVANVAPGVSVGGAAEVVAGASLDLVALTTDPSPLDAATLTVRWDFGDGSGVVYGASAGHVYTTPGIYTVRVVAEDDEAGVGEASHVVVVLGLSTQALTLSRVRDQSLNTEYDASSAEVAELRTAGDGGAVLVAGGVTKWMEARFVGPTLRHVQSAEVVLAHRMLSSRWAGTLRAELWSGATLLATRTLTKATSTLETRWDVSASVTPAQASALTVRLVNDVPGTARVSWAYAAISVTGY
jgi:competence protein ComEC